MITPTKTRGQPKLLVASNQPDSVGARAEARLRGAVIKLAAAGRSAGVTTAMTKEARVGTSIWDSSARNQQARS